MINELYIKDLAIIEEASIPFDTGLNVFTGETGAGKSILINGINSVLGQRTNKDIVRAGCDKAYISALFSEIPDELSAKLDELGISHEEGQIALAREIRADGGSIARINGKAASVSLLREIGAMLVNIHGQHDGQVLLDPDKHMGILDSFGQLEDDVAAYNASFRSLQEISRRIHNMAVEQKHRMEQTDKLRAICSEIDAAELHPGEDIELETEYRVAQSSEDIISALSAVSYIVQGDDDSRGVTDMLGDALRELAPVTDRSKAYASVYERIEQLRVELDDIAYDVVSERDSIDTDPGRLAYLRDKLDTIAKLKHKYGPELDDVLHCAEDAREKLAEMSTMSDEITELMHSRDELLHKVSDMAKELSAKRTAAGERFASQVCGELASLDMPDVRICVDIVQGKLTGSGLDTVEFLISTNKGEDLKPLSRIASGGELSRIMLALKSVVSERDSIGTLIFDEIDTGVSGRAAGKIAAKLHKVSEKRQVICVTHLSQLAAMADTHLLIEKRSDGKRTYTGVHKLDTEGRKREIARIMVGDNITDTALKNAEELIMSDRDNVKEKL
ncbi:MAG: DNA repair protein RecN [Oscillospiraceae bacterium]|nr:DNA repair protein RecN [Oscillospiraceae bacterium]